MARKLRVEYLGANYRVPNLGNHQEPMVRHAEDRPRYLDAVAEAGGRSCWQGNALGLILNPAGQKA